jgi:Zn-dependent peptidase ImmA (M78 family)
MKINRIDYSNNNTPILSKYEIERFAEDVLMDYKPHLLKEPGSIGHQHFIENYLGLPLLFRDIYYDNPKNPIFGTTIFGECAVKVFDKENERVKTELFWEDCIIIDNYVMQPGREGMANFTGIHEGAHYLMHPGITFPKRTRKIFCRRGDIDGAGNSQDIANRWVEYQANYFTASFTMPNRTFKPLVNNFLRKHDIWKGNIKLGLGEDLDILGSDLLPEYISEVYGVSKRAALNKLKTTGFIEA